MAVELMQIDPRSETGRALFAGSSAEQIARYGRDGGRAIDDLARPEVIFLAALQDGEPVGCGAVVPLESGVGELSRFYVANSARRKGIGRAILNRLEQLAAGRYQRLVLETGIAQEESMALYEACGYTSILCWGKSADNPRSRCYEKTLAGEKLAP